ncbi:low molecular weight phosphotyrosine protein phosphatase [Thermodesulfobacteriota bacterium]
MKILFICTANVSRSFMAEKLMKHELRKQNITHIAVVSAGIIQLSGGSPDPKMVEYLLEQGISAENHQPRQINAQDVEWADFIFVMEQAHADWITTRWPDSADKVRLLGRFVSADQSADDIADPFGRSDFFYRLAQSQIMFAVKSVVDKLISDPQSL